MTANMAKSKVEALRDYYDKAASAPEGFRFLSPIAMEGWCSAAALWLSSGRHVCEIGPGNGYLAQRVNALAKTPLQYLMLDISPRMLKKALANANTNGEGEVTYSGKVMDIASDDFTSLSETKSEKIIAINVLQDIDARSALVNIKEHLSGEGELWSTFIAREVQDIFWHEHEDYDCVKGCWYKSSCYHEARGAKPMGYRLVHGLEKPFYRILQCYTSQEIILLFDKAGYTTVSIEPIIYPTDFVLARWESKYHHIKIDQRQKQLLLNWQGYPDGWSVKARVR